VSIPKDGHYTAEIQYDTGGTLPTYVHVHNGIIRSIVGNEIKPDACSDFNPVSTQQFCGVWPREASIELEALRTANAGLVERVADRERERDHANDTASAVLADNDKLSEKVKLLTAAGHDSMDFINGIHREYSRVIEGWEKATK